LTQIEESCFSWCSLKSIFIPRNVEVLPKLCFSHSKLELITFDYKSGLTEIEELCFSWCSLKSICIPRNVEILPKLCFSHASLESIAFSLNHN
jgi:hypothetical protein